jgi:plasmid maintenance system antidote protein VapI
MAKHKMTWSETLRQTIADSGISHSEIERATGVNRSSIVRFAARQRTIRLDVADRLAKYFGLEMTQTVEPKTAKRKTAKKTKKPK